jgi:Flp pilus assembly protein TadD
LFCQKDILTETRLKSEHLLSDQWAEELLRNTCTSRFQALEDENRFKMDSILQALEKNDLTSVPAFNATQLPPLSADCGWASEFLTGEPGAADTSGNEVDQFFGKPNLPALNDNSQWAHEYLEKSPSLGVIGGSRVLAVTGNATDIETLQPNSSQNVGNNSIWSADFLQNAIVPSNQAVLTSSRSMPVAAMPPNFANAYSAFANAEVNPAVDILNEKVQLEKSEEAEKLNEKSAEATVEDRDDDELDYWNHMAEEFKKKMNENPEKYEGFLDTPEYNLPGLGDLKEEQNEEENAAMDKSDFSQYAFSENIEKANEETPEDAFELGLKHLKQGELPQAVTCFEVACHRQPEEAKHWQYLGIAQAQNEYDSAAIKALKRCLELNASNLSALMSLSVCYTNERMEAQACDTLRRWMLNNSKYNCLLGNDDVTASAAAGDSSQQSPLAQIGRPAASQQFKAVKEMFITAARLYPYEPDPDVQCGLGVLFNISGEYQKAIDCFRCALNVRPDDPALWNRLGASLANDGQSASAIAAYRRSLELNPGFTRTRYNIGISCISLGAYKEAVEHFLTVLNLQRLSAANDHSPAYQRPGLISQNVWNSLRYVLSMMHRRDLYPYLERRDLDHFNHEFGIEF